MILKSPWKLVVGVAVIALAHAARCVPEPSQPGPAMKARPSPTVLYRVYAHRDAAGAFYYYADTPGTPVYPGDEIIGTVVDAGSAGKL